VSTKHDDDFIDNLIDDVEVDDGEIMLTDNMDDEEEKKF
jgi:hypothetical protein